MTIYVPPDLALFSNAPTLMWYVFFFKFFLADSNRIHRIHGGSFIVGSATGPGLDGSKLAVATKSIVAVVQYRLGAVCHLLLVRLCMLISFEAGFHVT